VTPPTSILVGQVSDAFWIRVDGKGCFQNSVYVKEVFQEMISKSQSSFVIDLERCTTMDSTFMGTLTGAALQLRNVEGGGIAVVNANDRNQQLLSNLGLDNLLDIDADGHTWAKHKAAVLPALKQFSQDALTKEEQADHVLAAHEALCEVNPANAVRFQDVVGFLKREAE
jgi:anti-sigma B factor antagonist